MAFFIFSLFILIIAIVFFVVYKISKKSHALVNEHREKNGYRPSQNHIPGTMLVLSIAFGVISIAMLGWTCVVTTPASSANIITSFGSYQRTVYEGVDVKLPWQSTSLLQGGMRTMEIKTKSFSSDTQEASAIIVVSYRPMIAHAEKIFRLNPSLDYENQVIGPAIYEVKKAVDAKFTGEKLISERAEVSRQTLDSLRDRLKGMYVEIPTISVKEFDFSKDFKDSIEKKVIEAQLAQKEINTTTKVNEIANQTRARADAEAYAIEQNIKSLNAKGGREYIDLILAQKWNGVGPVYSTDGKLTPFIDVKK